MTVFLCIPAETRPNMQESLQQEAQALQPFETETAGNRNHHCEEAAPAKGIVKTEACVLSPYEVFHSVTLLFLPRTKPGCCG